MAENPNSARLDVSVNVTDNATPTLRTIESSVIRFVGAVSSALAVFSTVVFPIKQAADFQAELLNVAKTTNFTDDQISALRRNLVLMSADINLSAVELAKIAVIAGQLGVGGGVKGITAFTETTARFASVIDVSVEEAGNGLAKLINVFKVNVTESERLSSLLNEISNNSTASGAELLDIMNRIGTAGGTLNVKQSAALAALGRDLGVSVETIGTSFQKIFLDLQTKADKVAPLLGVTVDEFTTKLKTDGIGALKDYILALSKLPPAVQASFAEETTGGGRVFGLVNNLINDAKNGFELLDARLKNAEDGFEGGTSAIREQQRVMQGLTAQVKLVLNALSALVISVGDKAIPTLTRLARAFQEFLRDPQTIDRLGQFADALGEILSFIGDVVSGIAQFDFVLGPLLRTLQVFLAFKLVSYLFDIGAGLLRISRDARGTAAAFIALARGQTTVAEAAERAAAAQAAQAAGGGAAGRRGAQLGSLATAVGGALGAIPAEQARRATAAAEAAATAEAAVTAQKKAQADLQALIDQRRGFALASQREYLALDAAIAAQRRIVFDLEQRVAFVRAGNVDAQGASLRSLNAQLLVAREILATDELHLQTRIQELRVQGGLVTAATAEARAKVASAAAAAAAATAAATTAAAAAAEGAASIGLGRVAGVFRRFASTVGNILAGLFRFITGPIGFLLITVGSLLASFGVLDDIGDALARFVGISDTAAQRRERDARARAAADELEAQKVKQLAAEYDGLQKQIQNFDPNRANEAITSGDPAKFLKSISDNVSVVQAKIATTVSEIGGLATAGGAVELSFAATTEAIKKTEAQIASLENSLRNVKVVSQTSGGLFSSGDSTRQDLLKNFTDQLTEARARLAQLQQEQAGYAAAAKGLLDQQAEAQSAIPRLLEEENRLLQGAAPLYTAQAGALLEKAAAVARVREELQAQKKIEDEQKQAGAANSKDQKVIAEAAATQERIRSLKAELTVIQGQLNGLTNAAGPKAKAFIEAFGDGMKTSSKDIERNAALFRKAFSLDQGEIAAEFAKANNELENSKKKLEELRAKRAEFSKVLAFLPREGGVVGLAASNIDREIVALQAKIALRQAEVEATRRQIELGNELRAIADRGGISDREILRTRVQAGIQAGAQKIQLQQVERAQSAVATAAARTAEVYKSAYERAANAAASAVFDATRRIAQFQEAIANRARDIQLVRFDSSVLAQQRAATNEAARLTREFERQLDLQGIEGEERQAALDAYRQEADRKEEIRVKQLEIARIQVEYNVALQKAQDAEKIITDNAAKRIDLERQLEQAKKSGSASAVAAITAQLDTLNSKTKTAQDTLEKAQATVAELGAKVVSGEFVPAVSPIDPVKAEADLKRIGEIAAKAATEVAAQAKTLSDQAAANSRDANTALQTTKQALIDIQKAIESAANFTGLSVAAFENAGRKILETSGAYAQAALAVERIAKLDFSTGITLPDVPALNKAIQDGEAAILASATSVSKIIDGLSGGAVKNLGTAFKEALAVDIDVAAIERRVLEQQKNLKIQIDNITFPGAAESLKAALQPGGQPLKVPIELTGDINSAGQRNRVLPSFAGGGAVFGPGTTTSDSILARLSHGEYVNDARTTRTFGTGFFGLLKSIAHSGSSSVAQFLSTFGSVPLPRFAGGGAVSMAGGGSSMVANGPTDTVHVVLDVGGKSVSMFGQRDQADQLVRTLKNLGRSA